MREITNKEIIELAYWQASYLFDKEEEAFENWKHEHNGFESMLIKHSMRKYKHQMEQLKQMMEA